MSNLSGVELKPKNRKNKNGSNIISVLKKEEKKEDLSKFDPITGEKVAFEGMIQNKGGSNSVTQGLKGNQRIDPEKYKGLMRRRLMAVDEIKAEAKKGKTDPIDKWDAVKSGTIGTSAGFVLGNLLNTTARNKGLMSLGMGLGIAALDAKKQMSDYNSQMGARETLLGIDTPRKEAYLKNIKQKYKI